MKSITYCEPHCVINAICDALNVLRLGGTVRIAEYPFEKTAGGYNNHAQAQTLAPNEDGEMEWQYLTRHYSDNVTRTWGKNAPCVNDSLETFKSLEQFMAEQLPIQGVDTAKLLFFLNS